MHAKPEMEEKREKGKERGALGGPGFYTFFPLSSTLLVSSTNC